VCRGVAKAKKARIGVSKYGKSQKFYQKGEGKIDS
jgi:hypothetical protein